MISAPDLDRLIPDYIRRFQTYTPSKPDEELKKLYGCEVLHRLNNNENPLGPPPAARRVLEALRCERTAIYPSGDSYYLRLALAERFGKAPDQFLVANGSCEAISTVIKALCAPGDNIVTADRTFAVYEWVAEFSGLEARLVPLRDFGFDDEAMVDCLDARTKVIFVCNPNNPTGAYWNREKMVRFLDRVDGRAIVVVDEAYIEFVERDDFPDGLKLMEQYPNVVVFRTFSKMYGLAGLRVGYLAAGPDLIDYIRRAYVVYSVNTLGQAAARAAVEEGQEHVIRTRELVREARTVLCHVARRLGLAHQSGEGNYMMIEVPVNDTLLCRKLMRRGYMVRSMTGFRFPNWIRVTLVQKPILEGFGDALAREIQETIEEHSR